MSGLKRTLALGVLPLTVTLGLAVLAGRAAPPPELRATVPAACTQSPVFAPGYQRGEDYVVPRDAGFHFSSEAWVEATVCTPGTLAITASGELGGDEEPQLTVALGRTVLAAPRFGRERTVRVRVPGAGHLVLGFFNDLYESDSRVVYLREMELAGPGCQDFRAVRVEEGQGARLDPVTRTASLASGTPITFTPCRAGELRALLLGRRGNGTLPRLEIRQAEQVLYSQPVGTEWHLLRLQVQPGPLTLRLLNPYWKTLADRNLNVRRLNFTPDSTSPPTRP